MPPRRNGPGGPVPMGSFEHDDKRVNIPTADSEELLDPELARPVPVAWQRRDKSLDPQLVWKGKDEQYGEDLVVAAPPIYIQEKIVPQVIIENLRRANGQEQLDLFGDFDGLSGYEAVEYYEHEANWSNRMILGDSLQVMASLAEKENLRGKIQMIYIDPPYGIKFGSNWQVVTDKRDVSDGKAVDTTREVEQIKAFRDTWQLGIHSYLAYLRDRLTAARDLLTESGSVFVQIGDENVHLVRSILDEIFGSESFVSSIVLKTTSGAGSPSGGTLTLANVHDYLLWFAKDKSLIKYRRLYLPKQLGQGGADLYRRVRMADGSERSATPAEMQNPGTLPPGARLFRPDNLTSQSSPESSQFEVEINGLKIRPGKGGWKTNPDGMARLALASRLFVTRNNTLQYVRFLDDFPAYPLNNVWTDVGTGSFTEEKLYIEAYSKLRLKKYSPTAAR